MISVLAVQKRERESTNSNIIKNTETLKLEWGEISG